MLIPTACIFSTSVNQSLDLDLLFFPSNQTLIQLDVTYSVRLGSQWYHTTLLHILGVSNSVLNLYLSLMSSLDAPRLGGKNTLRTQLDSILASHRGNRTMSTMGIGRLRGQFHTSAHQHAATIQPARRPGGKLATWSVKVGSGLVAQQCYHCLSVTCLNS